jgi:hypothetical protein
MSMTLIAHTELGSAQNTVEFTSIPSTFTDLLVVVSLRSTFGAVVTDGNLTFNGTSANLTGRLLYGDGSGVGSASYTAIRYWHPGSTATSNTFANMQVYIPNYASSANKSVSIDQVSENNGTLSWQALFAGLWSNSAAINRVTFSDINGNFGQYSSATLYGITKGSSGGVVVS